MNASRDCLGASGGYEAGVYIHRGASDPLQQAFAARNEMSSVSCCRVRASTRMHLSCLRGNLLDL